MAYSSKFSHFTCRIIFFFLKSYLEGRAFLSTWMTLPPPQNLSLRSSSGAVISTTLFSLFLAAMPLPPSTNLALYADDTALLSQSWRPDSISRRLTHAVMTLLNCFTTWTLRLNNHKSETILFSKRPPPLIGPSSNAWHLCALDLDITIFRPCARLTTSLQEVLDHRRQQSHIRSLWHLPPQRSHSPKVNPLHSTHSSHLTFAAAVCSSSRPSNYLKPRAVQSKCLRVIGNYRRSTPNSHLHDSLNKEPIPVTIHRLTAKCPSHPNPPGPTNWQLYSSRSDCCVQKYKQ